VIITTIIPSCLFCENIACDQIPPDGHFIIVSATTGQDLVFGQNSIYDKNKFKFYSLSATDTTFFEYQIEEAVDSFFESSLDVLFVPLPKVAYMELSDGDIDTLDISSRTSENRCCGTSTVITNFRYNNSVDIPADTGYQVIMK